MSVIAWDRIMVHFQPFVLANVTNADDGYPVVWLTGTRETLHDGGC